MINQLKEIVCPNLGDFLSLPFKRFTTNKRKLQSFCFGIHVKGKQITLFFPLILWDFQAAIEVVDVFRLRSECELMISLVPSSVGEAGTLEAFFVLQVFCGSPFVSFSIQRSLLQIWKGNCSLQFLHNRRSNRAGCNRSFRSLQQTPHAQSTHSALVVRSAPWNSALGVCSAPWGTQKKNQLKQQHKCPYPDMHNRGAHVTRVCLRAQLTPPGPTARYQGLLCARPGSMAHARPRRTTRARTQGTTCGVAVCAQGTGRNM